MKLFKSTSVDVGDVKLGASNVRVFWSFEDLTPDMIAKYKNNKNKLVYAVSSDCGCTTPTVTDEGIEAFYNPGSNNTGKVTKQVKVYLKTDGEEVRVTKPNGIEVFNEEQRKVPLYFSANIV